MPESIHTIEREPGRVEELDSDYASPEYKEQVARQLARALGRRRSVKEVARTERCSGVPIQVLDEGPFSHYPASPADLGNVLALLPRGVTDGLGGVDLTLGEKYLRRQAEAQGLMPDPLTGRPGLEQIPGVYSGHILGVYAPRSAHIRLFAYVYDDSLPDREMWEGYFRLRMLSALVHEVAHHHERVRRATRGPLQPAEEDAAEGYAEEMQYAWVRDFVAPYLESTYPQQTAALVRWVEHYGGIALPLADLAGDPRFTDPSGRVRSAALFSMAAALKSLVESVSRGAGLRTTRLDFALRLHYQERHDDALTVIDCVLAEQPLDEKALTMKADILVQQGRYEEAAALAEQLQTGDPDSPELFEILSRAWRALRQWDRVVDASRQLQAMYPMHSVDWVGVVGQRGLTLAEMGDLAGAEADLATLAGCQTPYASLWVKRLSQALGK